MTPEPRRHLTVLTVFLTVAATATLAALVFGPAPVPRPPAASPATTGAASADDAGIAVGAAAVEAGAAQSVAFITTFNGTGSGVLVAEGLVVTNAHVVWPFDVASVRFPGGDRRNARVIGVDARADLAILEVPGPGLPRPLQVGSADDLREGEPLYVLGYPAAVDPVPDPTVAAARFLGGFDWDFSGVEWLAVDAPAIGGQSGGALVDAAGRLVGITTVGSTVELFAVAAADVVSVAETLTLRTDAIESRRPPRSGGAGEQQVVIEGPWAQATFVTWVMPGTQSRVTGPDDVTWRALDPFGVELATGTGEVEVSWLLGTPGILHATAAHSLDGEVVADAVLIPAPDPDDGRTIGAETPVSGFVDVPGDQDWYYLEHDEPGPLTVDVEAHTRMRVALYDRSTGSLVAEVRNERGFFFDDPPLAIDRLAPGGYAVVVEDIGAQFGTYEITLR